MLEIPTDDRDYSSVLSDVIDVVRNNQKSNEYTRIFEQIVRRLCVYGWYSTMWTDDGNFIHPRCLVQIRNKIRFISIDEKLDSISRKFRLNKVCVDFERYYIRNGSFLEFSLRSSIWIEYYLSECANIRVLLTMVLSPMYTFDAHSDI